MKLSEIRPSAVLLFLISSCLLIGLVASQRVIVSITSSQIPMLYNGYFTPDIKNNYWKWKGIELQGNENPYYGELSIPIQGFDPIIYRGHLSGNTNFVSNSYPFALISVAITPNSFNGTLVFDGSMQCGDNVTGGGAVGGTHVKGVSIDGKDNRCYTYQCHCGQCRDPVNVVMSVCYQPITPKPSWNKL